MAISNKDDVVLGSGELYLLEFTGIVPDDKSIEVENNKVGHIKGGASLEYTNEWKQISDDMGVVIKSFITKENVVFKSGMLSWNGKQLAMLCATSIVAEPTKEKPMRVLKIGGKKNANNKSYVIHFVHTKENGKKIKLTIVGTASNGLILTFDPENETVIDAEFKAVSQDDTGVLIVYKEEVSVA